MKGKRKNNHTEDKINIDVEIEKLAEGIQGDHQAACKDFDAIHKLCIPIIRSTVRYYYTSSESDVDDIVQDVFIKCWQRRTTRA